MKKCKFIEKINESIGEAYTLFINRKELIIIVPNKIENLKRELSMSFFIGYAAGNCKMKFSEVYFNARTALNFAIRENIFERNTVMIWCVTSVSFTMTCIITL